MSRRSPLERSSIKRAEQLLFRMEHFPHDFAPTLEFRMAIRGLLDYIERYEEVMSVMCLDFRSLPMDSEEWEELDNEEGDGLVVLDASTVRELRSAYELVEAETATAGVCNG